MAASEAGVRPHILGETPPAPRHVTRTRQAHVTYRCGGLLVETVIN